ncbi:hypothetical protein BSLG_004129 [Batrachochytrium salamandrivorans]|nr:hypothetical protein BSLG_004129 [Batrachochytrium salamandrivorans]
MDGTFHGVKDDDDLDSTSSSEGYGRHDYPESTEVDSNIDPNLLRRRVPKEKADEIALFMQFAAIAYCEVVNVHSVWDCGSLCEGEVEGTLVLSDLGVNPDYENRAGYGYIAIHSNKRMIVVSLRGTRYLSEWVKNMKFSKVDASHIFKSNIEGFIPENVQIHNGFLMIYLQVQQMILRTLKSAAEVYSTYSIHFTGHSLGGALASIAAVDAALVLGEQYARRMSIHTYGMPRIGNAQWVELFTKMRFSSVSRVVGFSDQIARLPATAMGYAHYGPTYGINADRLIVYCTNMPNSYEVIDCINTRNMILGPRQPHVNMYPFKSGCRIDNEALAARNPLVRGARSPSPLSQSQASNNDAVDGAVGANDDVIAAAAMADVTVDDVVATGIFGGSTDSTTGDAVDSTTYVTTDVTTGDSVDSTTDVTTGDSVDSTADVTTDGTTDDAVDVTTDGTTDVTTVDDAVGGSTDDGTVDDAVDVTDDGTADVTVDDAADVTADGTTDDAVDVTADGTTDDAVDVTADGATGDAVDAVDSTTDVTADGTTDDAVDVTTDVTTAGGTVDGNVDDAVGGTVDGNVDDAVGGSTVDGSVDDAVGGSTDDGITYVTASGATHSWSGRTKLRR